MILENLILVFSFIMIGSLARKTPWFPENSADVLNSFVLNIALPAIIFLTVSQLNFSMEALQPIILHWIVFPIHLALVYFLCKWFKLSRSIMASMMIVTTLGNTAFLGLPLSKSFFGEASLPFAILYDQIGSGFGFILFGAFLIPMFTGKESLSVKIILKQLLTFPAFLALSSGFIFNGVALNPHLVNILSQLAATLIPCAMISVGFQMQYRLSMNELKPLGLGLFLKLIIVPFMVIGIAKMLSFSGLATNVSILQSGMPPMITAGAMAIDNGIEKRLSASFVGYGLMLSFVTLPLFHWLIS